MIMCGIQIKGNIMNELVAYLLKEDYDFELKGSGSEPAELIIPLFGGRLILIADGIWCYEED